MTLFELKINKTIDDFVLANDTDTIERGRGSSPTGAPSRRTTGPPGGLSSLDLMGHNTTKYNDDSIWQNKTEYEKKVSRKKFRLFHRMSSGHRRHQGERLRHLTLTSKPGTDPTVLSKHKQRLIQEIRRLTPLKLVQKGFIDVNKVHHFYPGKSFSYGLEFQYLSLKTNEGNGVFHIPYYGDYLPQRWVSAVWERIHGAPNVFLTDYGAIKTNADKMTRYLLNQYISEHVGILETRLSWSRNWVFRRFVRVWDYVCKEEKNRFVRSTWWADICISGRPPPDYDDQSRLFDEVS